MFTPGLYMLCGRNIYKKCKKRDFYGDYVIDKKSLFGYPKNIKTGGT